MIPVSSSTFSDFTIEEESSKTFRLSGDKIIGTVDKLEALKQSIYIMLNTERYDHLIYSWDFGLDVKDLFGQDIGYVYPELKRRIEECLLQDDRILMVDTFSFEKKRGAVTVKFTVHSTLGDIDEEVSVSV